jgi:hypothetical protein
MTLKVRGAIFNDFKKNLDTIQWIDHVIGIETYEEDLEIINHWPLVLLRGSHIGLHVHLSFVEQSDLHYVVCVREGSEI